MPVSRPAGDFQWLVDIYIRSYTMNKTGLSLFEILVATMLLAVVVLSMANIFVSVKRYVQHYHCVTVAHELSKFYLERLHSEADQDTWATNCLGNNTGCLSETLVRNSIPYTATVVTSSPGVNLTIRRANITINWTEGP